MSLYDNYNNSDYDDFDEEPLRKEGPLNKFPKLKLSRPAIISFVLFYIASVLLNKYSVGDQLWASGKTVLEDHEYWRLITSVFTHSDILHLLSNAMIFFIFGWLLRAYFGFLIFPVFSFAMGALCTYLTISFYEPYMRLVGASGMNYAMAALWLVLYLRFNTYHFFAEKILRVFGFALVMLVPSTYNPQVSYLAHVFGFCIGIVSGIVLLPFVKARDPV